MISDSSFHGADGRFRTVITKSDTPSYEGLAFLYRLFTQRGPSHNQNPRPSTQRRKGNRGLPPRHAKTGHAGDPGLEGRKTNFNTEEPEKKNLRKQEVRK